MVKNEIILALSKASKVEEGKISIEFPENGGFGDYSSNIAMVVAKEQGKNPRELAQEIVDILQKDSKLSKYVERIEVAGPGFINFWLKNDVLVDNLRYIDTDKERYGRSDLNKGKLVIVEYSSPNIAKPFTVGHLRSTIIGDAVANLLEATGYKVLRDNHLGDWGTQFGKQIYAIKAWGDEQEIEKSDNPVKVLVGLYVKFHEVAETDPTLEDGARAWFKKLEDGDPEARRIWQKCIDWSFVEFDKIYSKLGIKFSNEFQKGRGLGESFFEGRMLAVVNELTKKKLLKEGKEGAKLVFFKNDKYPPAMIIKKDGTSLYHTRDLATDKYRKEKYNPDLVINEVGIEQKLYFEQLFEMEKLLGWYEEGQRLHIGHGLIRFKEGKMSTRKGNVIWMEEVLGEAQERAFSIGAQRQDAKAGPDEQLNNISELVAIGALKYNDLKRDPKTEVIFDWNEILNMEGNSGPYIQYTFARTQSVLEKAKGETFSKIVLDNLNEEELIVLRILSRYPEIITTAGKTYSPNTLCNYLYNLSQNYNSFYNKHKIIDSDNEGLRLLLTKCVGQVIENGLKLLGIKAPKRM